jgi:hypothetical protein
MGNRYLILLLVLRVSGNRQQGGSPALLLPGSPTALARGRFLPCALLPYSVVVFAFAVVVAVPLRAALCSCCCCCCSFAIIHLTSAYALSVFAQEASDGLLKHFVASLYTRCERQDIC